MQLSELRRLIYSYADDIFQLGDKLKNVLKTQELSHWQTLTVGITEVIPKTLAYQLLNPAINMAEPVRLVCNEGDQESLLADLAIDRLDLVLTGQPLQPGSFMKVYNHQLVKSGVTLFLLPNNWHLTVAKGFLNHYQDSLFFSRIKSPPSDSACHHGSRGTTSYPILSPSLMIAH